MSVPTDISIPVSSPLEGGQLEDRPGGRLVDYSPTDKPWDLHKAQADQVAVAYAQTSETVRLAGRVSACSGLLWFEWVRDDQGLLRLKLVSARFCRGRHCPICQWRRALMWQARFLKALPKIQARYPKARWIFLTLTVRNCALEELRATLQAMNQGWKRLLEKQPRKDQRDYTQHGWPALGFVRTTEVTRSDDGTAHPHFHALLMVPPAYFGRWYIPQADWVKLWQDTMRLNYVPSVDVRAVKPDRGQSPAEALRNAAAETLKYSVKPDDLVADPVWLAELTRQLRHLRFVSTGGVLKDVLHEAEQSKQDLIHPNGEEDSAGEQQLNVLGFDWDRPDQHYRRKFW